MRSFSQAVLGLHRLTRESTPAEFQRQALDLIKPLIPFDAAVWPTGTLLSEEVVVHTVHLAGVLPTFIESWEKHKHEDHLIQRVMRNPGKAVSVCVREEFAGTNILKHHCRPNRMEQVLCASELAAPTSLYNVVALYRDDPDAPFNARERMLFEAIIPHLTEAWMTSRIEYLKQSNEKSSSKWSSAIADDKGVLHVTDHRFVQHMLLEWPDWSGATLPEEICTLGRTPNGTYSGDRVSAKSRHVDGFILLDVRLRSEIDKLSSRERDIAERFAEGKSYKQIAIELEISPATVRTHLSTIYNKAGVKNKVELLELIRR